MIKTHIHLHAKHLFLSDFNETNFLDRLSKNNDITNFMKILLAGASCSVQRDGRTDAEHESNSHF